MIKQKQSIERAINTTKWLEYSTKNSDMKKSAYKNREGNTKCCLGELRDLLTGSPKMRRGKGKPGQAEGTEHSEVQSYQKSIGFPGTSKDLVVLELLVLSWERPEKDEARRNCGCYMKAVWALA